MDNQYNQPGGYPPQGQQPGAPGGFPDPYGQQPGLGEMANPYGQQPGLGDMANPYGQQSGFGDAANPYGQQPGYRNAAESFGTTASYPEMTPGYAAGQPGYGEAAPYGQQPGYGNAAERFGATSSYPDMTSGYAAQPGYQAPYADPGAQQAPYADPGAYQQPYAADGYQHLFNQGQGVPEQQPMGFPPQMLKPQRRRLTASDIALIVVAVVAVMGFAMWYLYSTYAPEVAKYGQITSGSLSASHAGDCLIVRNETPFDAEGVTSIAYDAEEGSRVERSDLVCRVYSTGYSTSAVDSLRRYREEIRDYQKKLIEQNTVYDGKLTRLDTELMSLVTQVRELIGGAQGSLSNLETQLTQKVEERQAHLDQKYAADQRFSRMQDDERSQTQRIDSWTKQYTATGSYIVSFYSDGYEYSVNRNTYTEFEPHEVRAMINGQKPELSTVQKGRTTIYRMVKDDEWFVLFLSKDTDWDPVNGETYELSLDRYENTQVTAEVVNYTRSGGELLVRLRVTSSVEPVMYMRSCEAVLGESMSTLMANERAIYVQDGMTGVVVVEGQTESFIPVNVIRVADGNAYFQAIQQGFLYEDMTVRLF